MTSGNKERERRTCDNGRTRLDRCDRDVVLHDLRAKVADAAPPRDLHELEEENASHAAPLPFVGDGDRGFGGSRILSVANETRDADAVLFLQIWGLYGRHDRDVTRGAFGPAPLLLARGR